MAITTRTVTEIKCDLCGETCTDERERLAYGIDDEAPAHGFGPPPYHVLHVELRGGRVSNAKPQEVVICPSCIEKPISSLPRIEGWSATAIATRRDAARAAREILAAASLSR
jgi:hypothetical protein